LDTSSLFKLYHKEQDSDLIKQIFTDHIVTTVFLSEIATIEFASTVWKKFRIRQMTELHAKTILSLFDADFYKYTFIQPESMIYHCAKDLVTKYGKQGLRTLDSIQLSTAISLKNQSSLFITSDKLLCAFFKQEELPIFSAL
jgi:predicted nucleic acid-binding protein